MPDLVQRFGVRFPGGPPQATQRFDRPASTLWHLARGRSAPNATHSIDNAARASDDMDRAHTVSAIIVELAGEEEWSSGWDIRLAHDWLSSMLTRSKIP